MGKDEFGFEEIVNKVARYDDGDKNTYIGEDGFVHCKKCGQAKQRWLEIPSIGMKQIVPMQCKCDSDREREIARLNDIKKHDIARNRCFKVKKMHDWTFEANGMLQYMVWTALADKHIGASLQHYNPLIDAGVKARWKLPESWRLMSQMPFGNIKTPAGSKEFLPLDARFKLFT